MPDAARQNPLIRFVNSGSLVSQIVAGLIIGTVLGLTWPDVGDAVGLLGDLFVGALKAVAPVLVLVLVAASIANKKTTETTHIRPILILYLLSTFLAALVPVVASFLWPSVIQLRDVSDALSPPESVA